MTASVIIPTLNAAGRLPDLFAALQAQTLPPDEILVVDSESDDGTAGVARELEGVVLWEISRNAFNHGTTRHEALLKANGDFVCFLTDDAVPADEHYLKNLLTPFQDERVATVSGRQLPKEDARRFEQLVREFNYPSESNVRSEADLPKFGIKTYFASNACSAYRRSAYLEVGGFQQVNTNEDMLIAASFIHAGYKVAYAANACVMHSHNFSFKDQLERNKAVGYFLETHSAEFSAQSELGEGKKMVGAIAKQLAHEKKLGELFAFGLDCSARLIGNRAGRRVARKEMAEAGRHA